MNKLELALAAVLVVAGLTSLALYQFVFIDPTEPDDWAAAGAWVVENISEGDVVRVEPHWREAGLVPLVDVGDQVDRLRDPLPEDYWRHENVFVVAESGRVSHAVESLAFAGPPAERKSFGTIDVLRFEIPDDLYQWELHDALSEVKVSRVKGAKVEKCEIWNEGNGRWDCAKRNRWLYVARDVREVGDDPRRCVYAHPLDKGRTLRLETTVPPSDTLRVRDSFSLRGARLPRDGEVLMQVFVNDQLKVEDRVAHDDHGYEAHDIDVSSIEGPAKLRIEVDLIGSIKDRYFCLNAWAR